MTVLDAARSLFGQPDELTQLADRLKSLRQDNRLFRDDTGADEVNHGAVPDFPRVDMWLVSYTRPLPPHVYVQDTALVVLEGAVQCWLGAPARPAFAWRSHGEPPLFIAGGTTRFAVPVNGPAGMLVIRPAHAADPRLQGDDRARQLFDAASRRYASR